MGKRLKRLSIIIPTYNNSSIFEECLSSIFKQNYPKEFFEVIVSDGGSDDSTIEIAKKYGAKTIHNPFRIEEKGKPLAFRKLAKGEIIAFFDADNVIPDEKDWLRNMVEVFDDEKISAADTLYYGFREKDNKITTYNALIGGDDPIASYIGINDRYCYFTGKWTGMPHEEIDRGKYIEVRFKKEKIPASGSNAFFIRRSVLNKVPHDPFIHPVFIYDMVNSGYNIMAKVKQELIHVQDGKLSTFFKKKMRRIKRRHSGEIKWKYNYDLDKKRIIRTALYILTLLPIYDMIKGFYRKPTIAWILHPIATFVLFFIYVYYGMKLKDLTNI